MLLFLIAGLVLPTASAQKYGPSAPAVVRSEHLSSEATQALLDAARSLVGEKELPDAVKAYKRYLNVRPRDLQARMELARIFSWQRNFPEALYIYNTLVKKIPDDPELELERARVLLWSGDYAETIITLEDLRDRLHAKTATSLENDQIETFSLALAGHGPAGLIDRVDRVLLDAYVWSGRTDDAMPLFERQWAIHPNDLDLGTSYARALSARRQFSRALQIYGELVASGKTDSEFRLERAKVMLWAEHYSDGLTELERLRLELHSDARLQLVSHRAMLEQISIALAAGYSWSADYQRAIQEYSVLVAKHANDPNLRLDLARAYRELNLLREALVQYDAYLALRTKDIAIGIERGKTLLWAEQYSEAIGTLIDWREQVRSLAGPGKTPEAYRPYVKELEQLLVQAYLWSGQPVQALPHLKRLLEVSPDEAGIALELGHALALAGLYPEARETFVQYRKKGGLASPALYGEGQTYQWEGDVLRARYAYRQALEASPPEPKAEVALASLEPDLGWNAFATTRTRRDVDGFHQRTVTGRMRLPAGILWIEPTVRYDSFSAPDLNAPTGRLHALLQADYRHSARLTVITQLGTLTTFDDSGRPSFPTAKLEARWKPNARGQWQFSAGVDDAVTYVYTAPALADQLRQLEASATLWRTLDAADVRPVWDVWARGRVFSLFRPSDENPNPGAQLNAAVTRTFPLRHELRPRLRLGLASGFRRLNHADPDYWSPKLYANGGLQSRLTVTPLDGMNTWIGLRAGAAYDSDVKAGFPEVELEWVLEHQLRERMGWRAMVSHGRTLRLQIGGDPEANVMNYWSTRALLEGWYTF